MNTNLKLLLLIALLINASSGYSQSCDDGSYNWDDIQNIFEAALCTSCHTGYELTHGQSELSFDEYQLFLDGGAICGTEILNGTNLVDIISFGTVACDNGTVFPIMNDLTLTSISNDDLIAIQTWIDEGFKEFCDSTTSVNTYIKYEISVYPNPAADWIKILNTQHDKEVITLKIFNTEGKFFIVESNYRYGDLMDISVLPTGVYFIQIQGTTEAFRLIKL